MAAETPLSYAGERSTLAPPRPDSHGGYAAMGLIMLAMIFIAFTSRYFVPSLPLFVHVHALLFTSWVVLFIVQAVLAQRGLFRYHRQLGMGGIAVAVLIVIVGFYTAIEGARRGHNPNGTAPNPFAFMIIPWVDIMLFGGFVFAAWYFRRRVELHKRLMLFGTLGGLIGPAIGRFPFLPEGPSRLAYMAAILLAVMALPAVTSWWTRRRVHWLDWAGAAVIIVSMPLRVLIGNTDAWQRFAAWTVS